MEISMVELHNKLLFPVYPVRNAKLKLAGSESPPASNRYERKFAVSELDGLELEWLLKLNPALFHSIYEPRYVNNIYLDTPDRQFFHDNVAGVASRLKVRIRWYGDTLGQIDAPTLELKIKNGLAGWKESFPLRPMMMEEISDRDALFQTFKDSDVPPHVNALLHALEPALLNRYRRAYFLSADKKFRATLDSDLSYARPYLFPGRAFNYVEDSELHILELKYAIPDEEYASKITGSFPFRLSKNSKYVRGMTVAG